MTLRHRLLPSPLTSVALLLAWLMLNESASPGQWLLGAVLALTIPWILMPLRPARSPLRSWQALMRLVIVVLWDILRSNLDVARRVLGRVSCGCRSIFGSRSPSCCWPASSPPPRARSRPS